MIDRRQFIAFALAAGAVRPARGDAPPAIRDFSFHVSDAELADLDARLAAVRWPEAATQTDWEQGPPLEAMRATTMSFGRTSSTDAATRPWERFGAS